MKVYICPACKQENPEEAKYCVKCGTWLLSSAYPATLKSKKTRRWTKPFGWIFAVIVALFIIGLVNQNETTAPAGAFQQQHAGSRSSPLPIGETLHGTITQSNLLGQTAKASFDVEMSVQEVIRGEEAWNKIKSANMFNSEPADGHEYLLALVHIKVLKSDDPDAQINVHNVHFTLVSSDGKDYSPVVVTLNDSINARLYAGAKHTGWAAFQVRKDDPSPVIAIARDFSGRGGFWFKTN